MLCVDVNVLIHLSNRASLQHDSAIAWLEQTITSGESIVIPEIVAAGFVRVSTDRRILENPITAEQALDLIESLLASPRSTMFAARTRTFTIFKTLAIDLGLRGNDITDAWIAAISLDLDATLVTFDRGFRRFPHLRVFDPAERAV